MDIRPATLLKKRLWRRFFPVNFAKFLRIPFLTEHLWWLLQQISKLHDTVLLLLQQDLLLKLSIVHAHIYGSFTYHGFEFTNLYVC